MATMKKAQAGMAVKKPVVKIEKKTTVKVAPTAKETKNLKDATQMKNMRPTGPTSGRVKPTMGKAKNGKSFPDLNKDGKITKADILKGRGVIAKKGASIKKAQDGIKSEPDYEKGLLERAGPMRKTKTKERSPDGDYVKKTVSRTRKGATTTSSKTRRTLQGVMNGAPSVSSMKSGGSVKKCKYGCN